MKFESLLSGQEVGGPPAAVEDRGESGGRTVVRLQKGEFPNYSRFIAAVGRWRPSVGGAGVRTRRVRWECARRSGLLSLTALMRF